MPHPTADDTTITVDDRYTIKTDTRSQHATRNGERVITHAITHWWLLDHNTPVAYMKTLYHTGDNTQHGGCPFVLCDIEVRDGHRRQGHTRRLVRAAEAHTGETLYTSGGFTPLGAQALGWLPVYPWETSPGVHYDDMTFVHDWDTLHPNSY